MPERARRALAGMEVEEVFDRDEHGRMKPTGALLNKLKFAAKIPALDLLAKHMQMFPRDVNTQVGPMFNITIHMTPDED